MASWKRVSLLKKIIYLCICVWNNAYLYLFYIPTTTLPPSQPVNSPLFQIHSERSSPPSASINHGKIIPCCHKTNLPPPCIQSGQGIRNSSQNSGNSPGRGPAVIARSHMNRPNSTIRSFLSTFFQVFFSQQLKKSNQYRNGIQCGL